MDAESVEELQLVIDVDVLTRLQINYSSCLEEGSEDSDSLEHGAIKFLVVPTHCCFV